MWFTNPYIKEIPMLTQETGNASALVSATMSMASNTQDEMTLHGSYHAELVRDGKVLWEEDFDNLVVTLGKNDFLDKYLAGAAYTASIFMGLKAVGTAVAADTQASHASWLEVGLANAPAYSGTRKTPAWSAASAGSKVVSAAVAFVFTSGGTVAGCFINSAGSATQDTTTGILFSAGDFGSSRAVLTSDTLNVTYTLSV